MKSFRFTQFLTFALLAFVTFGFVAVSHLQAEQIVYFPLDTNPGWTTEGQWAFGRPTGGGSHCYDPTSGHTGSNVYGYNLAGDYPNNMPAYRLRTTAINCSGYENVTLSFWRRLGVESASCDHASVEVSNNGSTWTTVWNHTGSSFCDGAWIQCTYNISAVADGQPTVYIRWTMGPTDSSVTYPGWNIDDVCLLGDPMDNLSITPSEDFVSSGSEGGPFTPEYKTYMLTNTGPDTLDWTATKTQSWLDVTPASGTLNPGNSNRVTVSLTGDANTLPAGNYSDVITFINVTSGFSQTRNATLNVKHVPGEIEVTDSIPPPDDLNMPFGEVIVGMRRTEQITITNTSPTHELTVTDISLGGGTIEDFEDGDMKEYVIRGGTHIVTAAAAHDGSFGLQCDGSGWAYRNDPNVTVAQGNVISYWMCLRATDGRVYCGFGASNLGTYSFVAASNTSQLILQRNQSFDFLDIGAVSHTWTYNKWYRMEVEWDISGDITGRLYDSDGTTLLKTVTAHDTTYLSGGIAFRSFGNYSNFLDTVERTTNPTYSALPVSSNLEYSIDSDRVTAKSEPGEVVGWDEENYAPIYKNHEVITSLSGSDEPMAAQNIQSSSAAFELGIIPKLPAVILPGDHIDVNVTFWPTELKEYKSSVIIESNDVDEPEVAVSLSGTGIPDYMEVMPDVSFTFAGHPGGPFVPTERSYELRNIGPYDIDWTVAGPDWLDIAPTGGDIQAGYSTTVDVWPNHNADLLPRGIYDANVVFANTTTGKIHYRKVILNVRTDPKIWTNPHLYDVTARQGEDFVTKLTIGNTGDADLEFNLVGTGLNYTPARKKAGEPLMLKLAGSEDEMVFEYVFDEPATEKLQDYDLLKMEGLELYEQTGAPIVPVRPVEILVPYGRQVVDCQVAAEDVLEMEDTFILPPAQKPYRLSYQGAIEPTMPDATIYGSDSPWPGKYFDKIGTQSKRGYQVFILNLFPLQYVPTTGRVSYASRIALTVSLADTAETATVMSSDSVKAWITASVDNPVTLKSYPEVSGMEESRISLTLPPGGPYEYVVITSQALNDAPGPWNFQALCDAKNADGISATIITTEWVYANYDGTKPSGGSDNQTRIRNFLIDAYQNWGTQYVLLGGTNAIVPARSFWVDSLVGDTVYMPVDMYYGCVEPSTCTFDYDADNKYGEPTDGVGGGEVDLFAEIYVGRAAVENATELANFVRKTLIYDTTEEEYLPRIAMLGEYLGFGGVSEYATESMEQIRTGGLFDGYYTCGFEEHNQPSFIDFNTIESMPGNPSCLWPLYDAPGYRWPIGNLTCLMNGGIHCFNHLGHADYTYCMKLYTSNLSSLTNDDYFFVYSQGCMPGGFDTTNCFAEVITSMEHGAFAVVMNARYGYGRGNSTDGPSQRYDRQFWDAPMGEGILEIGRANQDSKEDNVWNIGGSCMRWIYYELNLLGDPAQKFRFAQGCEWLTLEPSSGVVESGDSMDVNVIFDTNQPAGMYEGEITVYSNDPLTPELAIPIRMNLLPRDYFTELFEPNDPWDPNDPCANDMDNTSILFKPDGMGYYRMVCRQQAEDFPEDPNGSIVVLLGDDDYEIVDLNGICVSLYGKEYDRFYIGSNGYISFVSGDTAYLESLEQHFSLPRISALFDDLSPSEGGEISYKILPDKVVVTFENVPEYSMDNSNSFQVEMWFDGKIRITWLGIDACDGLVGLSDGFGLPLWFNQSDLSEYSVCNFVGDINGDLDTDLVDFAVLASYWCDSGQVTTVETVADQFNSISYSGNDGSQNWSNNWLEIGESDGPGAGSVRVVNSFQSYALRIGRFAKGKGLVREADLSSATFAMLTFDWWRGGPYYGNDTTVDISGDGGATWTTLLTIPNGRSMGSHSESFDVSAYIAPNTRIRFIANDWWGNGYIYFDNVQLEYDITRIKDPWCNECDFNQDFRIDFYDLLVLVEHWLE